MTPVRQHKRHIFFTTNYIGNIIMFKFLEKVYTQGGFLRLILVISQLTLLVAMFILLKTV